MTMDIGAITTRVERLGWNPGQAVARLRQPGPDETSTVALAMCEQLVAADVPIEALDLCLMFWSRALDGLSPGPVPPDRLARLDGELATEARWSLALQPWLAALRAPVTVAHDLDYVIRFLMRVRQLWATAVATAARASDSPPNRLPPQPGTVEHEVSVQRGMLTELIDYALYRWGQGREELARGLGNATSGLGRLFTVYREVRRRPGNRRGNPPEGRPELLANLKEGQSELRMAVPLLQQHAPDEAGALIEYLQMHLGLAAEVENGRGQAPDFLDHALYVGSQGREQLDLGLATAASGIMTVSSAYGNMFRRRWDYPFIIERLEAGRRELRQAMHLLDQHAPERASALIELVAMQIGLASDVYRSALELQARDARAGR